MTTKEYSGINIQWPISEKIIDGSKSIETRTYPIPPKFLNKEIVLIETPGKSGSFRSRIRAVIRFTGCFKYMSKKSFYKDSKHHLVTPSSEWAWEPSKGKWGWKVEVIKVFDDPIPMPKRTGVKYSSGIQI